MNTYMLLAYITGGVMVVYNLVIFLFPSRKTSLILKAISEVLVIVNNIFVYLATNNDLIIAGIVTTSISLTREIVFSFRNKCKVLNNIAWPIGYSVIFLCSLIFVYKRPISLLPVVGSVISTFSFYTNNQKLAKSGLILNCSLYIAYYLILIFENNNLLTLFSMLSSTAGLVSSIIGLIILFKIKTDKTYFRNE